MLSSQARFCAPTSSACFDGFTAFCLMKYCPVALPTSGADANQMLVRAPFSGVSKNGAPSANSRPIQPGLLRINRDYGWLRAADVLAEGDPDVLADIAAGTHELIEARCEAWRLEAEVWADERKRDPASDAGSLALVREQKERVRHLVERRKHLGFPVPDNCESWWTEYEGHSGERPARLPSRLAPRP